MSVALGQRVWKRQPDGGPHQLRFGLRPVRGAAITKAKVYVDGHLVLTRTGRQLRAVTLPGLPGKARHRVRLYQYTRRGLARTTTRDVYGCAR